MSKVVDRFLKYVTYDTQSDENSAAAPSTSKQLIFAKALVDELKNIGIKDVDLDDKGYVMASIKSNVNKKVPKVGFISHMDTSPEISGKSVKPKLVKNYDGGDIVLNREKNIILSPNDFPELKNYIGKTLITTDGNTLLGADDKSGVSEIVTAVEYLIDHPEVPHGDIKIAFTPDEEIGRGADHFDVKKFNADFAYTVDGGAVGGLECENFNAASAKVTITGRNVHPGSAKNKMLNSMLIAKEFMDMLPAGEVPSLTEGYEGFYHIVSICGSVEESHLEYIIRDFDKSNFEKRKNLIADSAEFLNKKYSRKIISVQIKDQYYNMKEKLESSRQIIDTAYKAIKEVGVEPHMLPIRGGTDGAMLSYMGLPTPNLFTGGENFHGKYEYIPTFAMEKCVEVILKIIELNL